MRIVIYETMIFLLMFLLEMIFW